ncbi:MAG: dihydropteroate synthase [Chloroflexia bacterium]
MCSGDGLADPAAAVERATRFLSAGADILDVGAMSTRPGSMPIPEELEAARLAGVISLLRPLTDALISADSYRPGPAAAALKAGADIINDVTGLQDARIARLAAAHAAAVVVMHIQGTPETMQLAPTYTDLIGEVRAGLALGVQTALDAGVPHESIILDPGVGFGKNLEHNLELLRRLGELRFFGLPLLVGVSRKGFIGKITGREVHDRVEGTAAAVALAIANGADIVRVHDVRSMVAVCRMADAIVRARPERE